LRNRVRTVKQENRDLLVGLLADVNRWVDTGTRFFPIYLSRRNINAQAPASIAVLNRKQVAFLNDCHPLKWIAMPSHRLTGSQMQTTHHRGPAMKHDFVCHSDPPLSDGDAN
jgi:hypothetical protein